MTPYEQYVKYCNLVDVKPMPENQWAETEGWITDRVAFKLPLEHKLQRQQNRNGSGRSFKPEVKDEQLRFEFAI